MSALPLQTVDVMAAAILLVALYTDLTRQKVPNRLTFGAMLLGLVIGGLEGRFLDALFGILAAFALMFPGWKFGGAIRAGDAKLLMAIGGLYGPAEILRCCLLTYILNIPFGLGVLLWKRRLGNLREHVRARMKKDVEAPALTIVAFVPVIVVAVLVARSTEVLKWF